MERKTVSSKTGRAQHLTKFSLLFIFLTIVLSSSAFGFKPPLTNISYSISSSQATLTIYDPYRDSQISYVGQGGSNVKESNGVVSWFSDTTMYCAVYDPARSNPWRIGAIENAVSNDLYQNANGIPGCYVDSGSSTGIKYAVYDADGGDFGIGSVATSANAEWAIGIGILEFYDPDGLNYLWGVAVDKRNPSNYKTKYGFFGDPFYLAPFSGTSVEFECDGDSYKWIYDFELASNNWRQIINGSGQTKAMAHIVAKQITHAVAPNNVWVFFDYSIAGGSGGGGSSSAIFGDGASFNGCPSFHPYISPTNYTIQYSISGDNGSDQYSVIISNNISASAPTGEISISETNPTYDNTVDLTFTYSATADRMRLKNESDSTWGAWQTISSSYSNWALSSGYGPKTVSVQFIDDDLKYVSNVATADINYYPAIAVTYPNGSEYLKQGKQYTITWTYAGSNDVDVELWNNGSYQATIASGVSSGTTSALYTIPVDHTETSTWIGANYKIRVKDTVYNHYDESDSNFHIGDIWITSPNGSESLTFRNGTTIQFTAKEIPSDPIKITLWKGGSKVGAIADNITITTADNSIPWNNVGDLLDEGLCTGINDEMEVALGSDFQIQARVGTTAFKDLSDSNFTIDGIRVIAPNGKYCDNGVIQDQVLTIGNSYLIQWDKYSLPTGLLKIVLYDGETAKAVLATDLANTTTQFNWTVGKDVNNNDISNCTGTNFRILVRVKDQIILDLSDNPFEIE